jgi:gliding motility-associated-like protein
VQSGLLPSNTNFQIAQNGTTTTSILSAIANDFYTNTTDISKTVTYKVIPLAVNGCLGDTFDIIVTILPEPVVNNTNLLDWCSNLAIGQAFPSSIPSSIPTAWYYVNSITLTNASPSNGTSLGVSTGPIAITNPLNPTIRPALNPLGQPSMVNDYYSSTGSNGTVIYLITPLSAQGCLGNPFTMSINIIPSTIQMENTDTLMICSGDTVDLNLLSNTPSLIPTWNAVTPNTTLQTPTFTVQTSAIIDDQLVNPETYTQEIVYSVNFVGIPTNPGSNCPGSASNVHVFVLPKPEIQAIDDQVLCPNISVNPIPVNINVPNSILTWSTIGDNIGLPIVSGNTILNPQLIPGYTTINNQQTDQQLIVNLNPYYTYIIPNTSLSKTCMGNPDTFNITVKPIPQMLNQNLTPVCSEVELGVPFSSSNNGVPGISSITGQPLGTISYNLTALNLNGLLIHSGNVGVSNGLSANDLMNDSFTNTGNSAESVIYNVIPVITYPIANGYLSCEGEMFTVTAPVNPEPHVNDITIEICSEEELAFNLPDNGNTYNLNTISHPNTFPNQFITVPQNNLLFSFTYSHAWTIDTVTVGQTPQNVIYNLQEVGTNGCLSDSFELSILVNPIPVVGFSINNLVNCSNSDLIFDNNSTTGIDYYWDFDDGTFTGVENPIHNYSLSGNYDIELIATYPATGCSSSFVENIDVNYTPNPEFTISDTEGCDTLDVTLIANDANSNWSYLWDFGTGETSNQPLFTMNQYTTEGCFDISLTISTPEGCTSSTTQNTAVCMYNTPQASFELDQYVINIYDTEIQTNNQTVDAVSYYWDFGDGSSTWEEEPIHSYGEGPATYIIDLTAYNEIGCYDIFSLSVLYKQDLVIYVPNTFTPDEDQFNQTFKPILTEGFKKDSYHLTIFNRWGEVVFESYDIEYGWDGTFGPNVKKAQDGTYTWKIEVEEIQNKETRQFLGHVNLIR